VFPVATEVNPLDPAQRAVCFLIWRCCLLARRNLEW
jgi:hypothetical protein